MTNRRISAGSLMPGAGGMVYVARCGNLYKIGWSATPLRRVRSLQTGSPYPIELVGTVDGGEAAERILHARFKDVRVRGEWFRLTEEEVAFILSMDDAIDHDPFDDMD